MGDRKHKDYQKLERKLFVNVALIMLTALVVVFLLQILARGYIGEFLVDAISVVFNMSRNHALWAYNNYIRGNLEYILMGAVAISFLVLSRFLLSRFAKYFREVSDSLDILVEEKAGEIELSPEMAAMERKIKTIKHTLDERERDARLAEQRKNDMVMYLAHDIKTPLTSVIGYLSLLDEAPDMPREQKAKYINITLAKANRLEKLVDEFFEITRYNFQIDSMARENIDLYYLMAQMADEFYPLLAEKGNHAVINVPEDMMIFGDPDKLARVFHNILKNAVAYSPENSAIDITAAHSGSTVTITFTNDGVIAQDKLTSIFDKFYRLDSARSSALGGAGLGLAIAKEIVTQHGGHIYASSADGRTSFTVQLPR